MKHHMSKTTAIATAVLIVFIISLGILLWFAYHQGLIDDGLSTAAVATTSDECTDAAVLILKQGGSAADAAICASLCQGIVVPQASGIGGGFLATIYTKNTAEIVTLNSREVAPLKATQELYLDNERATVEGGLSIAVPTEVKGLHELHRRFGKLSWSRVLEPAIHVAEKGFKVPNYLARVLSQYEEKIRRTDGFKDFYVNPKTNEIYREGDTLKNPQLAETLKIIAREGANAIYSTEGSLGQKLVNEIQANGGIVTMNDLRIYQPKFAPSVAVKLFQGDTLHTTNLPSSGSIFAFILNILEGYKFHENSFDFHRGNKLIYHRIVEAFKFGFGFRTSLGDETSEEVVETLLNVLDVDFANHIRAFINDEQTFNSSEYYRANTSVTIDHGTGHISILAPNGDAVALTSTINSIFGSWVMSNSTGIIFNNEMDDFSLPTASDGLIQSTANSIKAGKSPMSSMIPMILVNEKHDATLIVGGAGGIRIMTSLVLFLINHLYLKLSMEEALEMKRFHHQLQPMRVQFEDGYDQPDIVEYLRQKGHATVEAGPLLSAFASIIAISNRNGRVEFAIDPRRGGKGVIFDP
ncbi:hypothetical protein PVAND_008549 [Polypedilum vanderplanki]|uniref:Gamma-glutamyltranspeptidase n=1 Tax=Polypedilum vanderplanki TaxID=319348 RepID=A0A9J6CAL2_POLVA|nr:hypothetical protein PVAND_008549 [Polypedilum vanderplanki]